VIVSKRELLEHLYDYNWEHHSNVIEAHVSNLRKKLDAALGEREAEAAPVIETMRGRGYRMALEGPSATIAASGPDPGQPL
jgi:two-component system response regulator PhoP